MTLGVIHEMRGFGLGRKLMNYLTNHTELHVADYNQKAISFYLREGFYVNETIPNYYDINGESFGALHLIRPAKKKYFWSHFF